MKMSGAKQQRRRVFDSAQVRRVVGFAERDGLGAQRFYDLQLRRRLRNRRDDDRSPASAAPGELGKRIECRRGGAVAAQQLPEGDRTDVLAANQAQPCEPFRPIQAA